MFFFGGFELLPVALFGIILLGVLALTVGRVEPDPTGRRPYSIYLATIVFVSLFTVLIAGFSTISELAQLGFDGGDARFGEHCISGPGFDECTMGVGMSSFGPNIALEGRGDPNDAHIREAVRAALILLAAVAVLWLHARHFRDLQDEEGFLDSPAARVLLVYFYAVCFVTALVALGAAASAAYAIFRIALPDVSGFGHSDVERDQGFVQLISSGALAAAAVALFLFHWNRTERPRNPLSQETSE